MSNDGRGLVSSAMSCEGPPFESDPFGSVGDGWY